MTSISVQGPAPGVDPYVAMGVETERQLPGFWAFFKEMYPEYRGYGPADGPPIGAMLFPLCNQWGKAITAYVTAREKAFAERTLANIRPEIHNEVVYALELAASERLA